MSNPTSVPIESDIFHFRLHQEKPRKRTTRISLLVIGAVVWLLLYSIVAMRLWVQGFRWNDWFGALLIVTCITLATALFLGTYIVRHSPQDESRTLDHEISQWPALSLEGMMDLTPADFEEYVSRRIFERHGYEVHNVKDVKDGGIDILVTDVDGCKGIVQCKRYRSTVGEPTVRDLYGTMIHTGAVYAFLATNANISSAAHKWAKDKPIGLLDGRELIRLANA